MLSMGERLRKGGRGYRTQLAMLRHQKPHSVKEGILCYRGFFTNTHWPKKDCLSEIGLSMLFSRAEKKGLRMTV